MVEERKGEKQGRKKERGGEGGDERVVKVLRCMS